MENNLQNDGLEDFLKKSFERYSESPPDEVWGRIDAGLGLPGAVPVRRLFVRKWWSLASAAVLAGIIFYQQINYSGQVENLTRAVEKSNRQLQQVMNELQRQSEAAGSLNQPYPTLSNGVANGASADSQVPQTQVAKVSATTFLPESGGFEKALVSNENITTANGQSPTLPYPAETGSLQDGGALPINENPAEIASLSFLKNRAVFLTYTATDHPLPPLADLSAISFKPLKTKQFYAGLNATAFNTTGKITSFQRGGHHFERELNADVLSGKTYVAGLTLGCDLGKNWALESGVNYRETTFNTSHKPRFRSGHGGHHGNDHDLSYFLTTFSGVVEIEVRAEQSNPGEHLPQDQEFDMTVTAENSLKYVSVPLLAVYRLGQGRVHFAIKGGILGNYLIDNAFVVDNVHFNDGKFRSRGNMPASARQDDLKNFTFDYLVSAGVEFEVTPSWSLNLSPSLNGSLTSRHTDTLIKSTEYSAGLNAGLSYRF